MAGSYLEEARSWIGHKYRVSDVLAPGPARAMSALLDRDEAWIRTGVRLPPLWHWLYLHHPTPQSRLGPDGHERLGEFLPPLPFPRRMWAGGRVRFLEPLAIGTAATRVSSVVDVQEKHGRSGTFVLVIVRHRIEADGRLALDEEQHLAYLPGQPGQATSSATAPSVGPAGGTTSPAAPAPIVPAPSPEWTRPFEPSPTALFRFSALTFNAHRIHWDRSYATDVEGYPELVVHAPLLALLLLDGAGAHAGREPTAFEYRAHSPLFAGETIRLEGGASEVRALAPDGRIAMTGTVNWG